MDEICFFGFLSILVLAGSFIKYRRYQWAHRERMRLIENGLITDEKDLTQFQNIEKPGKRGLLFNIAFFLLALFQLLLILVYSLVALFFFFIIKSPGHIGFILFISLIGMLFTLGFTILSKTAAPLKNQRHFILLGCFFLTLFFCTVLGSQLKQISLTQVQDQIMQRFQTSMNSSDEEADIVEENNAETNESPPLPCDTVKEIGKGGAKKRNRTIIR